jgi:hypothetical protein
MNQFETYESFIMWAVAQQRAGRRDVITVKIGGKPYFADLALSRYMSFENAKRAMPDRAELIDAIEALDFAMSVNPGMRVN